MLNPKKKSIFEVLEFDGSLKNIPLANKHTYQVRLFHYTNALIQKMRWRAFYYEQKLCKKTNYVADNSDAHLNTSKLSTISKSLPFPTKKSAPICVKLIPFESELIDLINKVELKHVKTNNFQCNLRNKINSIKKSNKLVIFADKTNNLYKISPKNYNNLLLDNITKNYKKCNNNPADTIDSRAQELLNENNIVNKRIPKLERSQAYITVKDHKDNFPATVKCRLISKSKTHIGKISKQILTSIIKDVRTATSLIQWKNTGELLQWFNNIKNKSSKRFISFDIVEFYPSITKAHLINALDYASQFSNFNKSDTDIIFHSCDSLLFSGDDVWKKNDTDSYFDIPMGSFHGAEVCDLVGLYILDKLKSIFDNCGLYRDDGLGVIDLSKPLVYEKIKKSTFKLMSDIGFKITLEIGAQITNFLDVTLNLSNNTHRPYRKPNSLLNFINISSDHPYHIKKCLPVMTQKRLSTLSSNEKIFNEIKAPYETELRNRGFKCKLKYEKLDVDKKRKKPRNRHIMWYNPPYCSSVNINLGKEFLKLVDKHFPDSHFYNKIFNRKTVKISYSCMSNVKTLIQSHNKTVISNFNNRHIKANTNNNSINSNNKNKDSNNVDICNISNCTNHINNNNVNKSNNPNSSNLNYGNNNEQSIKSLNIKDIRCNSNCKSNDKKNTEINNTNNSVDYNNQRITRSIAKIIKENLEQASNNRTKSIMHNNNNTINKHSKSTKPFCDKLSNMPKTCNCRKINKDKCPLKGNCLIKNVIYKVKVESKGPDKIYIGSTAGSFKDRYANHKHTFKNINKKQSTRLSDYVWSFFHRYGKRPNMEWSIVSKIKHTSNGVSRICRTCNTERAVIAAEDKDLLLNKRQDLSNICPHNRRFYFK